MYTLLPVGGLGFLLSILRTSLRSGKKILNTKNGLPSPLQGSGFSAAVNRTHGNTSLSMKRPIHQEIKNIFLKLSG